MSLSEPLLFRDRAHAGALLAERIRGRALHRPILVAIPRGGVALGAEISEKLKLPLDVLFSKKIGAPEQPEFALGAVSEGGNVYLGRLAKGPWERGDLALHRAVEALQEQLIERSAAFRREFPRQELKGRSVIVVDDGIATGASLVAALQLIRKQEPKEILVAVPVASEDGAALVKEACDELVVLQVPRDFMAVGQFYRNFEPVEDREVTQLMRQCQAQGR